MLSTAQRVCFSLSPVFSGEYEVTAVGWVLVTLPSAFVAEVDVDDRCWSWWDSFVGCFVSFVRHAFDVIDCLDTSCPGAEVRKSVSHSLMKTLSAGLHFLSERFNVFKILCAN